MYSLNLFASIDAVETGCALNTNRYSIVVIQSSLGTKYETSE